MNPASGEPDGTPRHTRPGGRSARVRSAVLAAAREELAARGYAGFSCEAVAQRAGVNKTTVYRRWGTRENLILEVMIEQAERWVQVPDTGSLVSDLQAHAAAVVAGLMVPEFQEVARAVAATGDRADRVATASPRFWSNRFEHSGVIVERAVARGEVPPDTDPTLVIEMLTGPIYFRLLITGQPLDAGFAEHLVALVVAGARAGAAARG